MYGYVCVCVRVCMYICMDHGMYVTWCIYVGMFVCIYVCVSWFSLGGSAN